MRSIALGRVRAGWAAGVGLLLLLPVAVGCGPRTGTVSGRVLLGGAPLPGGRVTFRPADPRQNSVSAEIDEQGNYQVVLPVGEVMVSVDNQELAPRSPPGGPLALPGLSAEAQEKLRSAREAAPPAPDPGSGRPRPSGRYVPIPERYLLAESSGLEFKVHGGEQKHDLELKP
jgi:hypothetical protein